SPDLPNDARRYLAIADQELARVAHIAQQTLGFYRDTSRPIAFPFVRVIDDVLAVYDRRIKYKSLHVAREIESGLKVHALQGELKQIISNLVANAIDASREGGKIVIRGRSWRHPTTGLLGTRISVADNGGGISANDQKEVFAPFFTTKKE